MNICRLFDDIETPAVITSNLDEDSDALIHWLIGNRKTLDELLHDVGVVLLRGFDIVTNDQFASVCRAIRPKLRTYTGGDSPRTELIDKVYTSTEYPEQLEVLLHNELSYGGWFPSVVMFGCMIPPKTGGETPIADGRKILRNLDADVVHRFDKGGVTYLQYLWDEQSTVGPGKSWQETYESDDRETVERHLQQYNLDFSWTKHGLKTRATRPAIQIHPQTGVRCWHNQADQWHRELASVKDSVGTSQMLDTHSAGVDSFGNHVCLGNGDDILLDDLRHISQVSKQCEVVFPWQTGDLMVIDNVLAMHGRKAFTGDRRVLVSMA
jgi:alpha-ketoglutarate-dependent taurine dioxygenase